MHGAVLFPAVVPLLIFTLSFDGGCAEFIAEI